MSQETLLCENVTVEWPGGVIQFRRATGAQLELPLQVAGFPSYCPIVGRIYEWDGEQLKASASTRDQFVDMLPTITLRRLFRPLEGADPVEE